MNLSKSSILAIIATLSIAGQVKADCQSDAAELSQNEDLLDAVFTYVLGCGEDLLQGGVCDSSGLKEACENAGADFITYSGKLTCDDYYSSFQDFPECLPHSCIMEGEEEFENMVEDTFEFPEGLTNCKVDFDVDEISGGFSRNIMTGSLALLSLAGVGIALI